MSGLISFIFYILLGYFAYHFLQGLFKKDQSDTIVEGKQKSPPLDLKEEDVEDAKFKDVEE
ncbi:hypothetical protein JW835_01930 [bacterium]|nr:hypothetical protein [bacterium]